MWSGVTHRRKRKRSLLCGLASGSIYMCGREFELETDHKPLECIFSKMSKPSARIVRWVLRLQCHDYKVVYRPGKTNIADALSRMNISAIQKI